MFVVSEWKEAKDWSWPGYRVCFRYVNPQVGVLFETYSGITGRRKDRQANDGRSEY